MLKLPVAAPILIVVAAPNALTVVAPVFARVNVPPLTLRSLKPPICRLPVTLRLLFTVVVPVPAPMPIAVPAPNALTVVALVLNTLNDVLLVLTLLVKVGLFWNTRAPLPVSSLITPASCALVVAANWFNPLSVLARVPLVGNVTLVLAVVVTPRL